MSTDHNARQRRFYERTAKEYDRSVWSLGCRDNRNHEAKIRAVARAIGADEGGRVLEVGTGTGLHAAWLLRRTPVRHTGLDLSEPMLRIAQKRTAEFGERSRLLIGDAMKLPFADGSFDAAFCVGTLHHLADAGTGLRELARVVRPGGRVAALEPNWKYPSVMVYSAMTPEERKTFRITERRLLAWARGAGLASPRLDRVGYTPPKPAAWARTYDRLDRALSRTPGLRHLSITLLVSGTRA